MPNSLIRERQIKTVKDLTYSKNLGFFRCNKDTTEGVK